MNGEETAGFEQVVVMDAEHMRTAVRRIAQEIVTEFDDVNRLVVLGILRRGRPLADRLAADIRDMTGTAPRVGSLATTLYRDDLRSGVRPVKAPGAEIQTHFDFNIDGQAVILVDDVIAAGRTVRAALDEVMDYGRPKCIRLACLIDRGLRELPIRADYLGWSLSTRPEDHVSVRTKEIDGEDSVLLFRAPESEDEGRGQ